MAEKQYLLDGSLVPTRPHPDDDAVCSDGTECKRRDAFFDARGCAHRTDEERFDADVAIVQEILEEREKASEAYYTENGDYADSASYIVSECREDGVKAVKEWLSEEYYELFDYGEFNDFLEDMVAHVCEEIYSWGDYEPEYSYNEYDCYSGDGCCLYSLEVGECEEQVDIASCEELQALHDSGELDDILDELDREFCIGRSQRRVKNEDTGYYENVGRETYDPYDSDHPDIMIYTMPGGQWHYVVSAERMEELVQEFVDACGDCDDE